MIFPHAFVAKAETILDAARTRGLMVATAESCTGGLVAACLTEIAGSSAVVERGFVSYTNQSKIELLGVRADLIETHGAVSEEVARAMAEGALARSHAQVAVSITGVAGPGGGTVRKPVGLVHFGLAVAGCDTRAHVERFGAQGRARVRLAALDVALDLLLAGVTGVD